jgi:hypothetical protein
MSMLVLNVIDLQCFLANEIRIPGNDINIKTTKEERPTCNITALYLDSFRF